MPTSQDTLIAIEKRPATVDGPSCGIHSPLNLPPTKRHKYRMIALAAVHVPADELAHRSQ